MKEPGRRLIPARFCGQQDGQAKKRIAMLGEVEARTLTEYLARAIESREQLVGGPSLFCLLFDVRS